MQDRYLVLTPEKVVVSFDLGSVGSRVAAELIDILFIIAVMIGLSIAGTFAGLAFGTEMVTAILVVISAFSLFAYHALMEGLMQGQTLGKKVMKLRVIHVDGTPVNLRSAFLRNLLRPADMLPGLYLVGLILIFLNSKAQRIGDLVAGTTVVKIPAAQEGYTPAPHRVGVHPLEQMVPDLHNMNLEEYHAIKRLCDRFPFLPHEEQNRSIQEIWVPFAAKHHISEAKNVHPIYQMEAVVMKYGRLKNLV